MHHLNLCKIENLQDPLIAYVVTIIPFIDIFTVHSFQILVLEKERLKVRVSLFCFGPLSLLRIGVLDRTNSLQQFMLAYEFRK